MGIGRIFLFFGSKPQSETVLLYLIPSIKAKIKNTARVYANGKIFLIFKWIFFVISRFAIIKAMILLTMNVLR
jgi:hypothetical protein